MAAVVVVAWDLLGFRLRVWGLGFGSIWTQGHFERLTIDKIRYTPKPQIPKPRTLNPRLYVNPESSTAHPAHGKQLLEADVFITIRWTKLLHCLGSHTRLGSKA